MQPIGFTLMGCMFFFRLFLFASFSLCTFLQASPFLRLKNDKAGFSVVIPSDWQVMEHPFAALLACVPLSSYTYQFRPNLNVIAEEVPEGSTLFSLFNENVSYASKALYQFRVHQIEETQVGGFDAMKLVYSCRLSLQNDMLDIHNTVYCLLIESRFYLLTCSTLKEQFEEYEWLFDEVVQTFDFF